MKVNNAGVVADDHEFAGNALKSFAIVPSIRLIHRSMLMASLWKRYPIFLDKKISIVAIPILIHKQYYFAELKFIDTL